MIPNRKKYQAQVSKSKKYFPMEKSAPKVEKSETELSDGIFTDLSDEKDFDDASLLGLDEVGCYKGTGNLFNICLRVLTVFQPS